MGEYRTKFRIDAPSEVVWAVLADFKRHRDCKSIAPIDRGNLHVGSIISLTLAVPGRPSAKVKAQLLEVMPHRASPGTGTREPTGCSQATASSSSRKRTAAL